MTASPRLRAVRRRRPALVRPLSAKERQELIDRTPDLEVRDLFHRLLVERGELERRVQYAATHRRRLYIIARQLHALAIELDELLRPVIS